MNQVDGSSDLQLPQCPNPFKMERPKLKNVFRGPTIRTIIILIVTTLSLVSVSGGESKRDDETSESSSVGEQTCSQDVSSSSCNKNGTSGNNTEGVPLQTKLLLVQVIFRHGDRTPLFSYPKDPHKNLSGVPMLRSKRKGLLTKRGKVQAYELGNYLGSRYKDFFEKVWIPEDIYAQSSMTDRSIMTAQTCLAGIFIPFCSDDSSSEPGTGLGCDTRWSREIKWQPIPVYPLPPRKDNKIHILPSECPALMEEMDKVLRCDLMQEFQEKHKETFDYVKNHTGLGHVDMKNLGQVYDTLFIQSLYDLKLPDWTKKVYPEPMKTIEELGFQVLSGTRKMMRLNAGPLLRQVIENMKIAVKEEISRCQKKGKKPRSKRLYLFSGHDSTISAFLSALDVFEIHQPSYASAVLIELHQVVESEEDETGGNNEIKEGGTSIKDMIVKVYYRNSSKEPPREMIIPVCGSPCYLLKLETEMRDLLISDHDWRNECQGVYSWFTWLIRPFSNVISNLVRLFQNFVSNVFGCGCSKKGSSGKI